MMLSAVMQSNQSHLKFLNFELQQYIVILQEAKNNSDFYCTTRQTKNCAHKTDIAYLLLLLLVISPDVRSFFFPPNCLLLQPNASTAFFY